MDAGEIRALFDATPARARVVLSDRLFDSLAQVATPTGILAVVRTPAATALPRELETCLLLEGLQDPGNLGSILRTAVAAGIRQVFLGTGCAFAWAPKVLRAGQGAHFGLTIHEGVALAALAARFQGTVIATDPHADTSLFDLDLTGPVAWVFGAEGAAYRRSSAPPRRSAHGSRCPARPNRSTSPPRPRCACSSRCDSAHDSRTRNLRKSCEAGRARVRSARAVVDHAHPSRTPEPAKEP